MDGVNIQRLQDALDCLESEKLHDILEAKELIRKVLREVA